MISSPATNPLRVGLSRERVVDPCAVVIFGGTGDLAHRKLLPALYHLYLANLLPRAFAIVSYASPDMSVDEYRGSIRDSMKKVGDHLPVEGKKWDEFAAMIRYVRRTDDLAASFATLKDNLDKIDSELNTGGNYLFYFSVPPFVVKEYTAGLGEVGLAQGNGGRWRRVIVEKPFGENLDSARDLNRSLQQVFREDQVYRIDHYLGKETVQNIQVFRFANTFIDPLLNYRFVDSIQITVAEDGGIEGRGGYYDSTGALRDMVQNHLLQVLSVTCMEPPSSLEPELVRDEKVKLLRSVRRIEPEQMNEHAIRGQYGAGSMLGKDAPAYRDEEKVAKDSTTETYVAIKLYIDNWRWAGVPVYLRTGKRLAKRASEVAIQLRNVPTVIFGEPCRDEIQPDVIAINIQPDEGISIKFESKVPGLDCRIQPVRMDFRYGSAFGVSAPEAYERLLLDAMLGDPSLFARADGTEAAWEIVDQIREGWERMQSPIYFYTPGSWGPKEAAQLIERDGRVWRRL